MSQFVATEYLENVHRLALGIELIDTASERGLLHPVRVDIENGLPHSMKRVNAPHCGLQSFGRVPDSLCRHPSGRHALLYYPGIADNIILRIYDHSRYYVPRRLEVPLLTLKEFEDFEKTHLLQSNMHRLQRRPYLFPGAAYPVSSGATGIRGRVERDGQPMRWAFIEAMLPVSNQVVGRARSDDRGEFLLILSTWAALIALSRKFSVEIRVAGSTKAHEPDPADIQSIDMLWDLPLEILKELQPEEPDEVALGITLPADYVSVSRSVEIELGGILTGEEASFQFALP